jgi:hypothetical protein
VKSLTRLFIALAFLTILPRALAAGLTANVTWTNPTQYTDSTSLPATDIAYLTIQACEVNSPGTCIVQKVTPVNGTVPTSAVVPVVCGQYDFNITVTTTATATYPNATSGPSAIVPYASGVSCTPKVVTGLAVS